MLALIVSYGGPYGDLDHPRDKEMVVTVSMSAVAGRQDALGSLFECADRGRAAWRRAVP
jgi:hypothetical protein